MNNYDEQNQQQQNARPIQNAQANSYQHSNQHQNGSNNNAMPANQYQQANYPQGGNKYPANNQRKSYPSKNTRQAAPADFTVIKRILESTKEAFEGIVGANGLEVKFFEECIYAQQLIEANYNNTNNKDFSLASASEDSISKALILVANSGLTLNPQLGLAYLVPRWNSKASRLECHLEPSYRGLRRLGIDSGTIDSAVAELVYANDDFKWVDRFSKPKHDFDPFESNRGELKGGYCLARRPDGSFLCTPVNLTMLHKIRELSKGGVWGAWFEKMACKTIIRQGFNDWPIPTASPQSSLVTNLQNYLKNVDATTQEVLEKPVGTHDANSYIGAEQYPSPNCA